MGLGKRDGKIFFAGGFFATNGTGSTNVDILDPVNGVVSTLKLPEGRGRIAVSSVGSKVLFAGGQLNSRASSYYGKIDVYDAETQTMQTMDFNIGPVSERINALVAGSRVFLYSDKSTTVFIVDPIANTMDTLELPLTPSAATFGGDRVFFAGRSNYNVVINILNVGNMTWSAPRTVTWNSAVLGIVYFGDSLTLLSYTNLLNIGIDNPNRPLYESTFSERNMAAYNLIDEELYLIGPGFITVYRPYARLVRFRSSTLFLSGGQSVEENGIIYCSGGSGHQFPESVAQFDTRALLSTIVDRDYVIGIGYVHAAFGYVFRFLGRSQMIYYYNLRTNQQNVYNYPEQFSVSPDGQIQAGRKLLVFTASSREQYLVFNVDTETWTTNALPTTDRLAVATSSDDYVVLRNTTNIFVLDVATSEWTVLPALQYVPVHIVNDNIVLLDLATMKIYNMNTRKWRIGLEFYSLLTHAFVTVQNPTILITGIGEGSEFRKLHVYNVETNQYRIEETSFNGRIRMKALVHGDYVIYTGGYARSGKNDDSNRVDIYNVKTATWKSTILPPNLSFYSPPMVELAARDNLIFVARENRVDIVDIESSTNRPLLVPNSEPRSVRVIGSKIVFYSRRNVERQISVYETTTGESFSFAYNSGGDNQFYVTENFIVASTFADNLKAMELTTITNRLNDAQLFIGESVNFDVSVQGKVVSSYWQRDNVRLANETTFSLALNHVTQESMGTYSISLFDKCTQRITQQAKLEVYGPPVITAPLERSIIMCHELAPVEISATGKQMRFNWTLENENYVTSDPSVALAGASFTCNSAHELCVVAYNPSGSARSCNQLRVVDHDLVFDGPRPATSQSVWLSSSEVTLTVRLKDEECTEHEWFKNERPMNVSGTDSSSIRVTITPVITAASFHVVAVCGSSKLESYPFRFATVSSWTVLGVVLTSIGCAIGLMGLIIVAFLVRRRMIASQQHELELENLLTQAKSEVLNPEGAVPIVQSTTWEWSPGDGFTYKQIDKMPFIIDYSALNSLGKESVRVGVWNQSIIEISLRDAKSSSKVGGMRERLIDGTHIDIYAPQSPKYEIKVEPASVELDPRGVTYVTVSTTMRLTAKCKICLIVVNERDKIYSVIEFKMSSGMSTWIDLDEIESNGEYLGGGG